jgi:hypothetical protein
MAKPPPSTPHSDIDGVHQNERRNTDVAAERGESAEQLKKAAEQNVARPDYHDDQEHLDERTR